MSDEPQEAAEKAPEPSEQLITKDDPFLRSKIADMFGYEGEEDRYDTEIRRLLEYAKGKGAKSKEDVLWEVRRLDSKLMTGGYSSNRIKNLSNYLFLANERDKIETDMKRMEGLDG